MVAWEGDRTVTFTMEDALISAESFAILSGAGLVAATKDKPIYVHTTAQVEAIAPNTLKVDDLVCWNGGRTGKANTVSEEYTHSEADIFCMKLNEAGEVAVEPCVPVDVRHQADGTTIITCKAGDNVEKGNIVLVDYYVKKTGKAQMIEITADKFGGNYYLEASTLFRRESDGVDMPAEFVIPNCKVQSNFTFSMASSGDPSTFTFTMDAFPDYTKFDRTHKVLAAIQIIEDSDDSGDEEYREPCDAKPFNFEVTSYQNKANISIINDGALTVSGTGVDPKSYSSVSFGQDGHDPNGVQVSIKFPIPTTETGEYTVKQTNPGLGKYFNLPTDTDIEGNIKTKEYDAADLKTDTYDFLVTDQPGDIKIELIKNSTIIKTYTIKNEVKFA